MKKTTFDLYSIERTYREKTRVSFYFKSTKKIKKKFSPIDIDGERLRLNNETGEIVEYKKKQVLESRNASLRRTKILMEMLLQMNDFDWFWTLTFDKKRIDRTNAQVVFKAYEKYINYLKKKYPRFQYMTFPEQHEDGCYHFHLLTAGLTPREMGLVNSGKVCCSWAKKKYNGIASKEYFENTKHLHELKETDGEPVYNAMSFIYGFTTVSRIKSRERCNSYVKKYVEKALGSTDVFKKRFYYSANLKTPDIVKRLIGADFESPADIQDVPMVTEHPFVKYADDAPFVSEYNVLQVEIRNEFKKLIEQGEEPIQEL